MSLRKFVIGVVLFCAAQSVSAHAVPVLIHPQPSTVLPQAPLRVLIEFSERVEPGASSIAVYSPSGEKKILSNIRDPENPYQFNTEFPFKEEGTYAISWQVVSADDGHFSKGAYTFSAGEESVNEQAMTIEQGTATHDNFGLQATATVLELLGQALLLGILLLQLIPTFAALLPRRRTTILFVASILLMLMGAGMSIGVQSWTLSTNQEIGFTEALLAFGNTVAGRFGVYRIIVALIAVGLYVVRSRIPLLLAAFLLFALRARVSHAAASELLPAFSIVMNFLHLVAKDLWIGGLLAYSVLILPQLEKKSDGTMIAKSSLILGKIIAVALAVGGLTGCYIVWLHLKSPANIAQTHWGLMFELLAVAAALLLALRLLRVFKVDPALLHSNKDRDLARSHWVLLLSEACAGLTVLILSGMLIITTPPLDKGERYSITTESQGIEISIHEHLYEPENLLLILERKDGGIVPLKNLVVTLTNTEEGIGPIVTKPDLRFETAYAINGAEMIPEGDWKIDVTAQMNEGYDATATFQLHYMNDLHVIHDGNLVRSFGLFEKILIVTAILFILLAIYLYRLSSDRERHLHAVSSHTSDWSAQNLAIVLGFNLVIVLYLTLGHQSHFRSDFQGLCQRSGGIWQINVPERSGRLTSALLVPGCTVGQDFHFGDEREYRYFINSRSSVQAVP